MQLVDVLFSKHRRDIDAFSCVTTNYSLRCIKQCIPVFKLHNGSSLTGWND